MPQARNIRTPWLQAGCLALLIAGCAAAADPSAVTVTKTRTGGYQLLRNGKPYFIQGGGGSDRLDMLVEAGGNSIRTWSADGVGALLDEAHKRGFTVTVGFWLGHERHGFKYDNAKAVRAQFEKCRDAVRQYRNHPALLMWAVGNEMEGDGRKVAIWKAVEEIAAMCKKEDPNHPATTVIAEIGGGGVKVKMVHEHCPSIDILGINSYGGLASIPQRYKKAGGTKPYVITEYGPLGHWESGKTEWGAPLEENSTAKAKRYRDNYLKAIQENPMCLGGYAFKWGYKMEVTETWFSMILRGGIKTKSVDVMTELWTGKAPANRCPDISDIQVDRSSGLKPEDTVKASITASDPDGDKVKILWRLVRDSGRIPQGGDFQQDEPEYPGALVSTEEGNAVIKIPESGGGYRIYAYALDGKGAAATANVPIQVEGKVLPVKLRPVKLPFVVYDNAGGKTPWTPSGYMGNHAAISMDPAWRENPARGTSCIRVAYNGTSKWGGVVWQSPVNDWGAKPGGYNLTGAVALEFCARGETGGETVGFMVGIIPPSKPYPDSAVVKRANVKLGKDWKKYTIPLKGKDLSRIKTGFGWSASAKGKPVVFYLDEIRFVAEGEGVLTDE